MPTTTIQSLSLPWLQTGGTNSLVINPSEFKQDWLYGIPLCNPYNNQTLSEEVYKSKLLAAQTMIENELGVKLTQQLIVEQKDFVREEFSNWGFVKTSWQILHPCSLQGRLNEREIINYPTDWLTIRRSNASDNTSFKELYIIPNGQSSINFYQLSTTFPALFNFYGARVLPNYWNIKYVTGFKHIPNDLIQLIGLATAVQILPILEMSVGGGNPLAYGLASQSVSLDGLSQSTSKMGGGNIFQARMTLYKEQLKASLQSLKGIYGGIKFDVC